MRRIAIAVLCAAALAGCATVDSETSTVRIVTSAGGVAGCRFIASVRGDQNLYGGILFARAAYDDAINQMKAKTIAAGGNALFVASASTGLIGANAMGDAYRC